MSCVLIEKVVKRHTVVIWFGACSYSRLKMTYETQKQVCPLCLHELEDGAYYGSKIFAKDKNSVDYVRDSWLPLVEDGVIVWSVVSKGRGG